MRWRPESCGWPGIRTMTPAVPVIERALAMDQALAQRNSRQICPAILVFFAYESQLPDGNFAAAPELCPAVTGRDIGCLRQLFAPELDDGEVRHVRPLFHRSQRLRIEPIVQLMHAVGVAAYADENGGSHRNKGFRISQDDFEGLGMAADIFEGLQS